MTTAKHGYCLHCDRRALLFTFEESRTLCNSCGQYQDLEEIC